VSATPADRIVAHVFDRDCKTRLGWLHRARACEWVEVNSRRGWATFEVPLNDASTDLIELGRMVRLSWLHRGVYIGHFDARIKKEAVQLAVDGMRWLRFEQQPGIFDFLGDAGVDPEGGFDADASDTRNIGFMSPADQADWYIPTSWVPPHAQAWDGSEGGKTKNPPDFGSFDKTAAWISAITPSVTQPPRTCNYFRTVTLALNLAEAANVRILWSADNYADLYADGDLVASWTPPGGVLKWQTSDTIDMHLDAGEHLLAVRVRNALHVSDDPNHPNPIAFICSVREVLASGKLGDVLLNTNTVDWLVHDNSPEPGWPCAQVLHRLVNEAKALPIDALTPVRFGFHLKRDSHGRRWHDRDQSTFDCTGPSLAEYTTQLAETEMDVWMRGHGGPKLMAAIKRGRDRSGTVQLHLGGHVNGDGDQDGTLRTHEVTATMPAFTYAKVRLATGRWITVHNDAAVAAHGRIETRLSLGSSNSDDSARHIARGILEQNDKVKVEAQSEHTSLEGAVAYKHYRVGDVITVPGRRNSGTMKARVLAIRVKQTESGVDGQPEYTEDDSV
jgi:hypothetical protein